MSDTRTGAAPNYVVVGHVARDVVPGGYAPGGTALYAALAASRLGVATGVLTSAPPDMDVASVLGDAQVAVVPSREATIFENRYTPEGRVQFLRGRAAALGPGDVPGAWRGARMLHLGPIDDEVDPAIAAVFPRALRLATPQGWLRRWDSDECVYPLPHATILDRLPALDVVVMSEEDLAGERSPQEAVDAYRERVRIVVLTHGERGATVYAGKGVLHVPAFSAHEVDPTGAGDVFAAAFLVRYSEEKDLWGAARFAAAAASFVVEGRGASTVPTLAQVRERYQTSDVRHQPREADI